MCYIRQGNDLLKARQMRSYVGRSDIKKRLSTSKVLQSGDQVFYKRSNSGYWKGPGTVIGHDNKHVFVRYGGIYVCVSPCHLQPVVEPEKAENVGANAVESEFKKGTEIAEPEKKR